VYYKKCALRWVERLWRDLNRRNRAQKKKE
jgi:hypothetical protein